MVQPINPKYFAANANAAIDLGSAPVELRSGAVTITSPGKARLELKDQERVVVEVDTTFEGYRIGDDVGLRMKFGPRGRLIPVMPIQSQLGLRLS